MASIFDLVSSTGAADTGDDTVYGSGVLPGLDRAVGTATNILSAIQLAKQGKTVAPVQTTSGKLPVWLLPVGIGVVLLAVVTLFIARK